MRGRTDKCELDTGYVEVRIGSPSSLLNVSYTHVYWDEDAGKMLRIPLMAGDMSDLLENPSIPVVRTTAYAA